MTAFPRQEVDPEVVAGRNGDGLHLNGSTKIGLNRKVKICRMKIQMKINRVIKINMDFVNALIMCNS